MAATRSPAGYSGTPLLKKLGIKPAARLQALNAPAGLEEWLGPLPEGARWLGRGAKGLDTVLLFVTERRGLRRRLPGAQRSLAPAGALWLAWPKKTSSIATDLTREPVRAAGLAAGLVDVKVCAISEDWSGLKFVVPLTKR
ncbi:MAG: DUF3052 family protein [Myxococcota bacterium]